jgi:hypothetical protein
MIILSNYYFFICNFGDDASQVSTAVDHRLSNSIKISLIYFFKYELSGLVLAAAEYYFFTYYVLHSFNRFLEYD